MKLTPAEGAKLLKRLNEEYRALLERESQTCFFKAASTENPEELRPVYDYDEMTNALRELENKIRKLRHAMNQFNTTCEVPGFSMTIDEMLVYLPQLTRKKERLAELRSHLAKERMPLYSGSMIIDYLYANYDIEKAKEDFTKVADELNRAQMALDKLNANATFDFIG